MSPFAASLVAPRLFMAGDERRGGMHRAAHERGAGIRPSRFGKRFSKNRTFEAAWLVRVFRDAVCMHVRRIRRKTCIRLIVF
jgi:hypothetical protein